MDINKILLGPADHFRHPADICSANELTLEEKIRILKRWEYDARELQVADEENMGGGPPDRLVDVLAALHQLGYRGDAEHAPPTKQGGG